MERMFGKLSLEINIPMNDKSIQDMSPC